ncbi:MAG: SOS response-associated peptidase family protein [Selenomonas sp.]|nr:SOS response-associated peptidase family protein [Selenomonas sp.]MDD6120549.1 SOS response-associated peptidase family protein [Selenomonadaceae bacterium]
MCSRYGISERVEQYISSYGWNRQLIAGDVRPQDMAPVLARQGNMVAALPMAWGMHNPKTGQLIINAREESAAGKAMFSRSLRTQRCILPAEKFYEWDAAGHKVTFQREDDSLLHLCGIYRYEGAVPCFVILTKAADSMAIKGIGEETADVILLYAFREPVFVLDAYTRRILARMGATMQNDDERRAYFVKDLLNNSAVYGAYHWLLLEQGKRYCKKCPVCDECPLHDDCGKHLDR